jgi:hypothetical protein
MCFFKLLAKLPVVVHIASGDLFTFRKLSGIDVFAFQKLFTHVRMSLRWTSVGCGGVVLLSLKNLDG